MNPEVKAKWVAALRSGEYEQGSSVLARKRFPLETEPMGSMRYCCLGVLCEIAVNDGVINKATSGSRGISMYGDARDHSDIILPVAVREWAGLEERDPVVRYLDRDKEHLGLLNDEGVEFHVIADLIEEQL